jgi:hypothetical protein
MYSKAYLLLRFLALPNDTSSLLMMTIISQLFVLAFVATFQKAHDENPKQTGFDQERSSDETVL